MDFFQLYHFLNNSKFMKLPNDIITDLIWPMLSHPHQGRRGYPISKMNKCLKDLPRKYKAHPPIVYNLTNLNSDVFNNNNIKIPVKFIFRVNHSKKNIKYTRFGQPRLTCSRKYINIVERTIIDENDFKNYNITNLTQFNTFVRTLYYNSIDPSLPISGSYSF